MLPPPLRIATAFPRCPAVRLAILCCWLVVLAAFPGCQCNQGAGNANSQAQKKKADEEKKKKEQEKLPNFEMGKLQLLPHDDQQMQIYAKPGHWVTASVQTRANNFDASGELQTTLFNTGGAPHVLEGTPFRIAASRPVALAKGQAKYLDATWYLPERQTFLDYKLVGRAGNELLAASQPPSLMPRDQYYLVVLADNPDQYTYLSLLDVAQPPRPGLEAEEQVEYLRILRPRIGSTAPLPAHPLAWTMVAVVVWDNINPSSLTIDQQDAMLDWLHWGGNLIISGPDTLEKLEGGFLDAYLPADPAGAAELGPDSFRTLNENWSLLARNGERKDLRVLENEPLVGVRLEPRPQAAEVNGVGGLAYERRVGQGRILVTAFSLKQRPVVNWGSFDSFVNGCLLRRPARRYTQDAVGDLGLSWASSRYLLRDPRLISFQRYFSRDAGQALLGDGQAQDPLADDWRGRGYRASPFGGVAAWDHKSDVSARAREILGQAAGIKIPNAEFVVKVLAVYLFVLVPVNWLFFRLIGRVEYAWVAAPLIAIIGSIAVVKLAELDIGYARSRTEAAILEIHGDHPRGHLTRFTALYSSLSTPHRLQFSDPGALALPFPKQPERTLGLYDSTYQAVMRRAGDAVLDNFLVSSSSTQYARSEQMAPLTGVLRLAGDSSRGWSLENGAQFDLKDVILLRRETGSQGPLLWASLGDLPSKMAKDAQFTPAPAGLETTSELFNDVEAFAREPQEGQLSLRRFLELAVDSMEVLPGECRLIAWSDQDLPAMDVRPQVSQQQIRTMIVAHLGACDLPPCERDVNLRADFRPDEKPLSERDFLPEAPAPRAFGPPDDGLGGPPADDGS